MIKYQPGTVMPDEYNWQEQFALENVFVAFSMMDVGKVRGLAIAYEKLEAEVIKWKKEVIKWQDTNTELEAENERLREHIALLEEDIRCYQADL